MPSMRESAGALLPAAVQSVVEAAVQSGAGGRCSAGTGRRNQAVARAPPSSNAARRKWNALHYQILQRLVTEVSRASIEMQALGQRVEALAARVDFNDRRVRTLETAPPPARSARSPGDGSDGTSPAAASPAPAPPAATTTNSSPPAADAPRRRRRRRGVAAVRSLAGRAPLRRRQMPSSRMTPRISMKATTKKTGGESGR